VQTVTVTAYLISVTAQVCYSSAQLRCVTVTVTAQVCYSYSSGVFQLRCVTVTVTAQVCYSHSSGVLQLSSGVLQLQVQLRCVTAQLRCVTVTLDQRLYSFTVRNYIYISPYSSRYPIALLLRPETVFLSV